MSDFSSLTELARFVGRSDLEAADVTTPRRHRGITQAKAKPARRSVAELLGAVLVLSARTRRVVLPKVTIDLDVFSPEGHRAVRLLLPR